jgi:hypothetical protein
MTGNSTGEEFQYFNVLLAIQSNPGGATADNQI